MYALEEEFLTGGTINYSYLDCETIVDREGDGYADMLEDRIVEPEWEYIEPEPPQCPSLMADDIPF